MPKFKPGTADFSVVCSGFESNVIAVFRHLKYLSIVGNVSWSASCY